MARRRVFIFPAASLVAKEVVHSLGALPGYDLVGGGFTENFGWRGEFDEFFYVPGIDDDGFSKRMLEVIEASGATHIYPTSDASIRILAREFEFESVTHVSHPSETVGIVSAKKLTADFFQSSPFTPRYYTESCLPDEFPVFAKPNYGHSSIGARRLDDLEALREAEREANFWDDNLVAEYLPGTEVTVDCFSTLDDGLLFSRARIRSRVERGVAVETADFWDPELDQMANEISSALRFSGAWFFQAKKSKYEEFKLLEIGARLAGSSALRRAQGINLAHLSILASDRLEIRVKDSGINLMGKIEDGSQRFYSSLKFGRLFVDLDDTLLHDGVVSSKVIGLISHANSRGAEVVLITRAAYDPEKALAKFGIESYFSSVIHVTDGSPKSSHIPEGEPCLFMDDSFSEWSSFADRDDVYCVDPSVADQIRGLF